MASFAKVFMSGRSQALRLPASMRLSVKEVRIEKIGEDLWVHPERPPEKDMGAWLINFYASTEPLPADFMQDRQDELPQERDWG